MPFSLHFTRHQQELLENRLATLTARFKEYTRNREDTLQDTLYEETEKMLAERPPTWVVANMIEQNLILLMPAKTISVAFQQYLLKAENLLNAKATELYRNALEGKEAETRRQYLLEMVRTLQWEQAKHKIKRRCIINIRFKTSILFALSLIPFYMITWEWFQDFTGIQAQARTGIILRGLNAGFMGACFSMLLSYRSFSSDEKLEVLEFSQSILNLFFRGIIGLGAAMIAYYFLQAGLLTGAVLPKFPTTEQISPSGTNLLTLNPVDMSLYLLCCFLAGFSEKLVPSLLSKAEATMDRQEPTKAATPQIPPGNMENQAGG